MSANARKDTRKQIKLIAKVYCKQHFHKISLIPVPVFRLEARLSSNLKRAIINYLNIVNLLFYLFTKELIALLEQYIANTIVLDIVQIRQR